MANRREEEGERGNSFLKVAAGLGIGYAAYKNRNQLIKGVSGVLKSGKVNLSRTANSASFRGTIGEMKSLSSAVVETYGQASPRNVARAYLNPESRKTQLKRNLATYNKDLNKRLEINALDDVYQSQQRLGDRNKGNHRKAMRDASIINMRNAARRPDSPYRDAFGENFENVIRIFENNAEWLMKDPAKGLRKTTDANGKEIFDEYNVNIKKLFDEYNYNPKRNINLGIHPRDEESQKNFVRNMMDLSLESYTKTQEQVDEAKYVAKKAGGAVTGKGNVYAQHKQLYDIGLFESVRKTHAEKNSDKFTKLMTENGYSQITMAQARDGVAEERNGKLFLVKSAIDNKGRTIEDRYSTPLRTSSSADTLGLNSKTKSQPFARQYIQAGERMGLDRSDLEQHVFSNQLFLDNKSGEVVNVQGMGKLTTEMADYFQQNWQIPFLNMNPLDFLPKRTLAKERNATIFEIYEEGKDFFTFMDQDKYNLRRVDESRNTTSYAKILNQSYMHVDGDIFDTGISKEMSGLTDADAYRIFREKSSNYLVAENYDSVSLNSGMYKHYADVISDRTNIENFDKPGPIKQLFGLGQENETVFGKIKRAVTKFDDPMYAENIVGEIYKRSDNGWLSSEEVVEQAYANLFGRTKNLSPNSKEAVYDVLGDLINRQSNMSLENMDLYDIKTDDGLMGIAQKISESFRWRSEPETMLDTTQKRIRNNLEKEISQQFFGDYLPDQQGFLNRTRYLKSRNIYVPDKMGNVMEDETVGVKASDDLRKLIEEYGIALADEKGVDLNKSIISTPGIFPNDVRAEIGELRALGQMDYFNTKTKGNSVKDIDENQIEWLTFYKNNPENLSNLEYSLAKTDPWYGTGAGEKRDDLLGANKRTPIKKHTTLQESINASLSKAGEEQPFNHEDFNNAAALAEGIFNWSKQGGTLFAGRHGNITDASVIPWHLANRLDTPLQKLGLGLPNHLKDSPQSILFNQWARRIVLPYAAFQTAVYFDGMTGDATSDAAADAYVNMHEDVNRVKEFTGINNWGRDMQKIMPWGEQIGAIAPVKAFNFATFGLFSDFRTAEDVEKYYTSGEDPIRKGRFWDIGSNSPWMGNKIDRYEANWYRKAKSDYQFSDNMYGSESEYWANSWMPTLTHPFAPIKHFITDPYHYEDKHAESRPYAVTGGFAELQNIPLVGPAIDTVASSVFKPQRTNRRLKESHQAYLSAYNERLSAAYINMNAGGVVNMGPNGSMTLSSDVFDVNFMDENGQLNEEALIADEMTFNAERDRMAIGLMNNTGIIPQLPGGTMAGGFLGRIFSAVGNGGGDGSIVPVPEDQIAALTETYGEGNVAGVGTVGRSGSASAQYLLSQMNARLTDGKTMNRNDQVSQAGTIADPNVLLKLNGAVNQASLFNPNGVMRDIAYNAGEFAGMYGFLSKTAFGFEESGRGTTLESSDRFNNYNDMFWENELGGLGGDLSEIGRRYIPRDPNKDYYNPIRNTMPSWLDLLVSINSLNCWKPLRALRTKA